jgi:ribonuclease HII
LCLLRAAKVDKVEYGSKSNMLCRKIVCGIDEVGLGSLIGPVVAAAVVVASDVQHDAQIRTQGIRDSKLLSAKKRALLDEWIRSHALAVGIGMADLQSIHEHNVLGASHRAMRAAVDALEPAAVRPTIQYFYVDGSFFPSTLTSDSGVQFKGEAVVKGDQLIPSVSCASIVAKHYRDTVIIPELHARYPEYKWDENKGYATAKHLAAIRQYGLSPFHRRYDALLKYAPRV